MAQHYSIIYIYIYISSWLNTRPYAMHAVFAWQAGKARPLPAAAARQVWPHRARLWTPAGQPAGVLRQLVRQRHREGHVLAQ